MYGYGYGQQPQAASQPEWYRTMAMPANYAAQGAAIAGCGIGVLFLIVLLPWCTMQRVALLNNHVITGFLIDKLEIRASLWDIHLTPTCGDQGIPGVAQLSTTVCHMAQGLWGHHLIMDMNSHACQIEEATRGIPGREFLVRGSFGCDNFNLLSVGSLICIACVLGAVACHFACALNVFTYYWQDTTARRRMFIVFFGGCAPCAAVTGMLGYGLLFNVSHIIAPGTLRPPPGIIYPVGWGTVLFGAAVTSSLLQTAVLLLYLDKLPSEDETLKFEQYTNYSAMLQQEAMLQQQPSATAGWGAARTDGWGAGY